MTYKAVKKALHPCPFGREFQDLTSSKEILHSPVMALVHRDRACHLAKRTLDGTVVTLQSSHPAAHNGFHSLRVAV